MYRRDEKGRIVKENDHIMDATRYLVSAPAKHWELLQSPAPVARSAPRIPLDPGMGY